MTVFTFFVFLFSFKLEELERESEFWKKNKPQENGQGNFMPVSNSMSQIG